MRLWSPLLIVLFGVVFAAPSVHLGGPERPDPTWADDVAPILFQNCVGCHRPGGSAPFGLLTWADAAERADRLARAVGTGAMPPWLPASDGPAYVGSRGLSAEQIETVRAWVASGAPAGDLAEAPRPPEQTSDWYLGPPDLVVDLPEFETPAEGTDIYRNLVVPIPVEGERWVRAVDLRPGNARVVHHARMMVDYTSSSRRADEEDATPGFDGMDVRTEASNPEGHFVGWTPGKRLLPSQDGMAWRVDSSTDLVAQLHLRLTGEPEIVRGQVGFYFAESAPTEHPAILIISSMDIDIPPGETDYRISNSFTLPVPVEVLSIYPHAHYLGKEMIVTALRPDGRQITLLHIPDWDFDWQDEYRLVDPIRLPAGTTILKEFSYDNSAMNPDNPFSPPQRVVFGSNSTDEMGDLVLQVLPESEGDRAALLAAQAWQHDAEDMGYMAIRAVRAGEAALAEGRAGEAVPHFQEALQYRSDNVEALVGLATAFAEQGDGASASFIADQAVALTDGQDGAALAARAHAWFALGNQRRALDAVGEAMRLARQQGDTRLVALLEARREEYERGGG